MIDTDWKRLIEELLARIRELEARVADLEQRLGPIP